MSRGFELIVLEMEVNHKKKIRLIILQKKEEKRRVWRDGHPAVSP